MITKKGISYFIIVNFYFLTENIEFQQADYGWTQIGPPGGVVSGPMGTKMASANKTGSGQQLTALPAEQLV